MRILSTRTTAAITSRADGTPPAPVLLVVAAYGPPTSLRPIESLGAAASLVRNRPPSPKQTYAYIRQK